MNPIFFTMITALLLFSVYWYSYNISSSRSRFLTELNYGANQERKKGEKREFVFRWQLVRGQKFYVLFLINLYFENIYISLY